MTVYPNLDKLKGDLVAGEDGENRYNVLGSPQRRVRGTGAARNSQGLLFGEQPQLGHAKHEQIMGLSPTRKRRAVSPVRTSGSPERRMRIRQLERGLTPSPIKQEGVVAKDYDTKNASGFSDRYIKDYLQNIDQRLDRIESNQLLILQQLEKLNANK